METTNVPMSAREPVARFVGPEREDTYDHPAIEEPLQIRLAMAMKV